MKRPSGNSRPDLTGLDYWAPIWQKGIGMTFDPDTFRIN